MVASSVAPFLFIGSTWVHCLVTLSPFSSHFIHSFAPEKFFPERSSPEVDALLRSLDRNSISVQCFVPFTSFRLITVLLIS